MIDCFISCIKRKWQEKIILTLTLTTTLKIKSIKAFSNDRVTERNEL